MWDITQWCKQQGILVGFGRGSGCGSLVAYLLGLTHINPFDYDLLFERFLNIGRLGKPTDVEYIRVNDDFIIESNKTLRVSRNGIELSVPATDLAENDVILDESVLRRA